MMRYKTQNKDDSPKVSYDSSKRLFSGLVLAVTGLICIILFLLWLVPAFGFDNIHPWLPRIAAILNILLIFVVVLFSLSLFGGHNFPFLQQIRGLAIRIFLPLAEALGRILGFSLDEVRRSFIRSNNNLVLKAFKGAVPANKLLLLLPHCLQASSCPHRLTHNPDNCGRCGGCVQGSLLQLRDFFGVHMAVATGGTIARRIVVQIKPYLIVAVACERDLASGIQDTYPLPVYGVLNKRPCGPCLDTTLDLNNVNKALCYFIKHDENTGKNA